MKLLLFAIQRTTNFEGVLAKRFTGCTLSDIPGVRRKKKQRELEKQVIFACGARGDPWRRDSLSLSLLCGTTRPSLVRADNIYPRQGFFCVSSVHTHARDLLEWNRIIRDRVIRASREMILNMEENNEPPFYFISSLFSQLACCDPEAFRATTSL